MADDFDKYADPKESNKAFDGGDAFSDPKASMAAFDSEKPSKKEPGDDKRALYLRILDKYPDVAIPKHPTGGGIVSAAEGTTLGFLPNIYAGLRAAQARISNPSGPGLGDNYTAAMDEYKNRSKELKSGMPPLADFAGQAGGSALTMGGGMSAMRGLNPRLASGAAASVPGITMSALANMGFGRGGSVEQNALDASGLQHAIDIKQDVRNGEYGSAAMDALGVAGSPLGIIGFGGIASALQKPTVNVLAGKMNASRAAAADTTQKAAEFFKAQEATSRSAIPGKAIQIAKQFGGDEAGGVSGGTEASEMGSNSDIGSVAARQASQSGNSAEALRVAQVRIASGIGSPEDHNLVRQFAQRMQKIPGLSPDESGNVSSRVRRAQSGGATSILEQDDILKGQEPAKTIGGDDGSTTPKATSGGTNPARPSTMGGAPKTSPEPSSIPMDWNWNWTGENMSKGSPAPKPLMASDYQIEGNPRPESSYRLPGDVLQGENIPVRNRYMKALTGNVAPPYQSPVSGVANATLNPKELIARYIGSKIGMSAPPSPVLNDFNKSQLYEYLARKASGSLSPPPGMLASHKADQKENKTSAHDDRQP